MTAISLPALHSGQIEIVSQAKRFNILQCGRRFGKSILGETLACHTALGNGQGFPVGWFAPTYKYLLEPWRDLNAWLEPAIKSSNQQEKRIELLTGGIIDFWSLDDEDAGRSRKYRRVIIDEGGLVRDLQRRWEFAIRPTLADLKGDAWFLGTPKGRNYFHTLFTRGQADEDNWASWRRGTVHNPHIDRDEIEEARRSLPKAAFDQEYLGIPADDGGNPFGIDAIHGCIVPLSTKPPAAWGWDLAKSVDWTWGIALDANGRICRSVRWQSPWRDSIARILRETGGIPALVDSTGVGDPVLEQLQAGHSNFEGFKFSSASKQQLMEGLAIGIQRAEIGIPREADPLLAELESFAYEYTRTGVRYSAPTGLHDDGVMALALAWKQLRERPALVGRPPDLSGDAYFSRV